MYLVLALAVKCITKYQRKFQPYFFILQDKLWNKALKGI